MLFWQTSYSAAEDDVWSLDEVHIGSNMGLKFIDEPFRSSDLSDDFFEAAPHSKVESFCGRPALHFSVPSGDNDHQVFLDTRPLNLEDGAYVQLDLSTGCLNVDPDFDFNLRFELSDNNGGSWQTVGTSCNPLISSCKQWNWHGEPVFNSFDYTGGYTRVTLVLPSPQVAGRRFRLTAPEDRMSDFAIANFYLGAGCGGDGGCGPYGRCVNETLCVCQSSYAYNAEIGRCVFVQRATSLREMFDDEIRPSHFARFRGGTNGEPSCGVLSGYNSVEFRGPASRFIETVDLDLRGGQFVQLTLRMGSLVSSSQCQRPTQTSEGVVLAYSVSAGVHWTAIIEFSYFLYRSGEALFVELPPAARTVATRLMLWQPSSSARNYDVWGVDDLFIGPQVGALALAAAASFSSPPPLPEKQFLFHTNGERAQFCSRDNVLLYRGTSGAFTLDTAPLTVGAGAIFQFEIATACSGALPSRAFEIRLQTANAKGGSFSDVASSVCNPAFESSCSTYEGQGVSRFPSYDFADGWRRVVWPLPAAQAQRYRLVVTTSGSTTFALDNIYVGAGTHNACDGHGTFVNGSCVCDAGYASTGASCTPAGRIQPLEVRENFNDQVSPALWSKLLGGTPVPASNACGYIGDGLALRFSGQGTRLLETVGLNLTSAHFVQYLVRLGSSRSTSSCRTPSISEGIVLSYSVDGGLTWRRLENFFSTGQVDPTRRLVALPPSARTINTRLQWWQPSHTPSTDFDVWMLDDIYIGPPPTNGVIDELEDNFDDVDETNFLTVRGGAITELCGSEGSAMSFATSSASDYTLETRELKLALDEIVLIEKPLPAILASPSWDVENSHGFMREQSCGLLTPGYVFRQGSTRELRTSALDTRPDNLQLSFFLAIGAGGCDGVETTSLRDEDVHLEYSTNSGESWIDIGSYRTTNGATQVLLTEAMQSRATVFRWIQREIAQVEDEDVWALADVEVSQASDKLK